MDIKMLHKSNTFSSLSTAGSNSGGPNGAHSANGVGAAASAHNVAPAKRGGASSIASWFDRRARKLSMKCSKSITLGKHVT